MATFVGADTPAQAGDPPASEGGRLDYRGRSAYDERIISCYFVPVKIE
jgi:hypothetical protein